MLLQSKGSKKWSLATSGGRSSRRLFVPQQLGWDKLLQTTDCWHSVVIVRLCVLLTRPVDYHNVVIVFSCVISGWPLVCKSQGIVRKELSRKLFTVLVSGHPQICLLFCKTLITGYKICPLWLKMLNFLVHFSATLFKNTILECLYWNEQKSAGANAYSNATTFRTTDCLFSYCVTFRF